MSRAQALGRAAAREGTARQVSPAQVERSLDQLSYLLDGVFRIPGTGWRFGLDTVVGLVPGVGDTLTSVLSFYILAAGVRYRVPKVTLLRMGVNLAVDYLLGAIPLAGDLFDAYWKANQMNVELLRRRATVTPEEAHAGRASDWLFLGLIILCLVGLLLGSVLVAVYLLRLAYAHAPSFF